MQKKRGKVFGKKAQELTRNGVEILSVAFLVLAIIFLSFNITGFSISNALASLPSYAGVSFFFLGLVGALIALKLS